MERVLCVVCVEYKGLGATVMSRHATSSVMQDSLQYHHRPRLRTECYTI
jgi:hypothetical protein